MIGILTAYDENEKQAQKEKISFVHVTSENPEDVRIEMSETALRFANKFNLEKVYLYFGKDEKIVYDYKI